MGGTMGQLASGHDLEKLQEALNAAGSTTKVQGWLTAGHAVAGHASTGQAATGHAAHAHSKALFVDAPFMKMMSTSTTAIFAYGGQGLFMETMAEMRRPQDFPKVNTSEYLPYLRRADSVLLRILTSNLLHTVHTATSSMKIGI